MMRLNNGFLSLMTFILIVLGLLSIVVGLSLLAFREYKDVRQLQEDAFDLVTTSLVQLREEKQKLPIDDIAKLIEAITKLLLLKTGPAAFLALYGLASFCIGAWIKLRLMNR